MRISMRIEDGYISGGRPKKTWMDCVKDGMGKKGVSMTADRKDLKKKICCADRNHNVTEQKKL